jgi:hypothetical protein
MRLNSCVLSCLILIVAGLSGCSNSPSGKESQKTGILRDKIQGKAQIVLAETSATDKTLSAGGPSVYLVVNKRRYRLFLNTPLEAEGSKEYIAEGVLAQKVIDELGDPDEGKHGYPLAASCKRAIKMAWPSLSLDAAAAQASALRVVVNRYPARPILLVTKIEPVEGSGADSAKDVKSEEDLPVVTVAQAKQEALLVEGSTVQPAPLWAPTAATVLCKVIFDSKGKFAELETGAQLCESVDWSKFRFQPTVERGRPVRVRTEVEMHFEARKVVPSS